MTLASQCGFYMKTTKLNWVLNSRAYLKAKKLMSSTMSSPERLSKLITDAQNKFGRYKGGTLSNIIEPFATAIRLIKAYASGNYRDIPKERLALLVTSIVYFVMPIDVVPDFILTLGHLDDIAVLTWTFQTVADELKKFVLWETQKESEQAPTMVIEDQSKDEPA